MSSFAAIMRTFQDDGREDERRWWNELRRLYAADDVAGFWRHYAEYLQSRTNVSERRLMLRDMARKAAEAIDR